MLTTSYGRLPPAALWPPQLRLLHMYAGARLRSEGGQAGAGAAAAGGAAQRQTKLHHLSGQQSAIPVMNCLISFFNAFIWNSSLR